MNSSHNPYRDQIDFAALALQDKDFNKFVKTNGQLNFSDPAAVKQLTKSLLKRDFNLTIDLPDDRLCPPVPNRLNYVLWLQDLVDQTSTNFNSHTYDASREVTGLDMSISGTGASAIYPLLATALRPRWRMLASDIDAASLLHATRNIAANGQLQPSSSSSSSSSSSRIKLLPQKSPSDPLLPLDELGIPALDFAMTNPPFYASRAELISAAEAKARPPNSACTGAEVEMVYADGGEVGFVRRLVDESCRLRRRVQWYSSMLGKLGSVGEVVAVLREKGCSNYCVTEFVQGNRTRRWAVAWSWQAFRPGLHTARAAAGPGVEKALLPFPTEMTLDFESGDIESIEREIDKKISDLGMNWNWKRNIMTGVGLANGNVWSRAARRKKQSTARGHASVGDGGDDQMDEDEVEKEDEELALAFKIQVRARAKGGIEVHIRWLAGQDSVLFESFCGMLKRHLASF